MVSAATAAAVAVHFKAIIAILHGAGLSNSDIYLYLSGLVTDWWVKLTGL